MTPDLQLRAMSVCMAVVAAFTFGSRSALGQGGPPLVTDDLETPG